MTTLTSPIDLLNAIPFMIGFQPSDSIVVVGTKIEEIEFAMRIDFPDDVQPEQFDEVVSHLVENESTHALLVSYVPDAVNDVDLILKTLTDGIESRGISIRESLIVVGDRWRSLLCDDRECCPLEGSQMPELGSSRIAAEQISSGFPLPFESAHAMTQSLESLPHDLMLEELIRSIPPIDYEQDPHPLQRQGAECFLDFLHDFQSDGVCRDKELVARLLVRLQDLQVRDFALGSVTPAKLALYFDALRWLMRIAPQGYVAPVATLFAAIAYEKGDGALAQRAIDRALDDSPNYALATLLRQVFNAGYRPDLFSSMRSELHPKVCDAIFSGSMMG